MTDLVEVNTESNVIVTEPAGLDLLEVTNESIVGFVEQQIDVVEVVEQGLPGPPGLNGYVNQRREFLALVDGEQLITLPSVPTVGAPINVYLNGLLHATSADYSSSSNILTITPAVGVMAGDHITILYQ